MPDRPDIFTLTSMHESGMDRLRAAGNPRMATAVDPETLRREVGDADALIVRTGGDIDAPLMDRAPRLKVIGRHGVGYDQIDVPAATARGIQVVYTPGANTESVVQHVIAMMIGLSKHFPKMSAALVAGDYHARTKMVGRELTGRTVGIVGFGRIGRRVGAVLHQAFGMRVLYNDIAAAPREVEERAGATWVGFEDALRQSQYVTLHVPLDESTRGMIHRGSLAMMRTDAILINACRGPVVDEAAVAAALDAGQLWGYGGDVFTVEPPPPDHPLIGRLDVMLTPHSAAQTEEGLRNMAEGVVGDVLGVLRGDAPINPVNDPAEVAAARARLGLEPFGVAWDVVDHGS